MDKYIMLPCFFKKYTGFDCLGCGMQRAFWLLIEGDFEGSFNMYPPLIPLLVLFLYTGLSLIFKFENGGRYILIGAIIVVGIMIISYVFKHFI